MEGTTYLEHPALGVSLDSRLKEGMSHTKIIEQSVIGEGPIVRPETAVTSERHHEQTCFKLPARPTPASGLADVETDINTDRSENSSPGITSEIFEQSVLREGSIVRPETAVTSERHHRQTGCDLSAQPTPAIVIVRKTDVNSDKHRLVGDFSSKEFVGDIRANRARGAVERPTGSGGCVTATSRTDMF